jgi:hypothetical protein
MNERRFETGGLQASINLIFTLASSQHPCTEEYENRSLNGLQRHKVTETYPPMRRDLRLPQLAVFVHEVVAIASKPRISPTELWASGPSSHTLMIQVGGSCD